MLENLFIIGSKIFWYVQSKKEVTSNTNTKESKPEESPNAPTAPPVQKPVPVVSDTPVTPEVSVKVPPKESPVNPKPKESPNKSPKNVKKPKCTASLTTSTPTLSKSEKKQKQTRNGKQSSEKKKAPAESDEKKEPVVTKKDDKKDDEKNTEKKFDKNDAKKDDKKPETPKQIESQTPEDFFKKHKTEIMIFNYYESEIILRSYESKDEIGESNSLYKIEDLKVPFKLIKTPTKMEDLQCGKAYLLENEYTIENNPKWTKENKLGYISLIAKTPIQLVHFLHGNLSVKDYDVLLEISTRYNSLIANHIYQILKEFDESTTKDFEFVEIIRHGFEHPERNTKVKYETDIERTLWNNEKNKQTNYVIYQKELYTKDFNRQFIFLQKFLTFAHNKNYPEMEHENNVIETEEAKKYKYIKVETTPFEREMTLACTIISIYGKYKDYTTTFEIETEILTIEEYNFKNILEHVLCSCISNIVQFMRNKRIKAEYGDPQKLDTEPVCISKARNFRQLYYSHFVYDYGCLVNGKKEDFKKPFLIRQPYLTEDKVIGIGNILEKWKKCWNLQIFKKKNFQKYQDAKTLQRQKKKNWK
jgi:hypothetical protein